ncbi:MAG: dTDP-4-dehydrorhamnose 3,5-epimerase [Methylococcus sp.]|jgi:dTDP-4-dehydrorhamnose 3,5-epimerase|nr:MAG: dTDP-4-dehydrorhamnose 3,5-epimerase [Methylococcus sp.]
MIIDTTPLAGLLLIKPDVYGDSRGFFQETWNLRRYTEEGLDRHFVQDNLSFSRKGTLRGLHFQNPHAQGKLVYVLQGEVFDVAVDVRADSPTFGQWYGVTLSAENHQQLFVPEGFAHGFCVTSDTALFAYKCTDFYRPDLEFSLLWNDPELGIDWPVTDPQLSDKDRQGQPLAEFVRDSLAVW